MSATSRTIRAHRCLQWTLAAWLPAVGLIAEARGQDAAAEAPQLSPAQLAQIEAAKTVEELTNLAKDWVIQKQTAAAQKCVETICTRNPELLTDGKRQSPAKWNDFWFTQRAAIREKQLAPNDAAGRVEIATWLRQGGAQEPARQWLEKAMEIDPKLPQALALAEEWNLAGGGPVQFDLRLGLSQTLRPPTIQDENQEVAPIKGKAFLLLPFVYDPGEGKLILNKTDLKATSDDDKSCTVKGMLLISGGGGLRADSGGPASPSASPLQIQSGSEPLWERIQVERGEEGQAYSLTCYNTTRPRAVGAAEERPSGRPPAAERSGSGSGRSSVSERGSSYGRSSSSGRSGGSSGRYSAPDRGSTGETGDAKQTRQGEGHAAFVLEMPAAAKVVKCSHRLGPTLQVDVKWLSALCAPLGDVPQDQRDPLVQTLAEFSADKQGPIARASIQRLAMIRSGGGSGAQSQAPTADLRLDRAMLAAMAHGDRQTRQTAFDALIAQAPPLTEETLDLVLKSRDAEVLGAVLEEIEAALAKAPPADGTRQPQSWGAAPGAGSRGELIEQIVALLPESPAPANVFAVLSACLNSGSPDIRQRAAEIVLKDGKRQSAALLAEAAAQTRDALIAQLPTVKDEQLKAAVLRILLIRAQAASIPKLVAAGEGLALTVTSVQDPLLVRLTDRQPPEVVQALLELLARADLSAVSGTAEFKRILESLTAGERTHAGVRAAALKLALAHFDLPYQAPLKASATFRGGGGQPEVSAFEVLLAAVAADPGSDARTAHSAAEALLSAGRITALNDELHRRTDAGPRAQDLIRHLSKDRKWWSREALPAFLASRLGDADAQTQRLALATLAMLFKATDARQVWKLQLAIKQSLDVGQLVKLSAGGEETVAGLATDLLVRLALMNAADAQEFQLITGESARNERLTARDNDRRGKPRGSFACMLYVHVEPRAVDAAATPDRRGGGPPTPAGLLTPAGPPSRTLHEMHNVPLASSNVVLQPVGEKDVRILVDGRSIGKSEGGQGSLRLDAAPLLRAALRSPDAEQAGWAGQVGSLPTTQDLLCELQYEPLGTWAGEFTVSDTSGQLGSARPLRISGGRIFLEPVAP